MCALFLKFLLFSFPQDQDTRLFIRDFSVLLCADLTLIRSLVGGQVSPEVFHRKQCWHMIWLAAIYFKHCEI